jgi:F-type H+-transporting ATPase subunit gamma
MRRVLSRLAARASNYSHPLLEERKDLHYVVVLMTADKGLCGSFNTNLIKAAEQFLREHYDKKVELITIGRKGRDFFRRRKAPILREYLNLTARTVNYSDAAEIARKLIEDYTAEGSTIDRVFLLYSEFKSVLTQRVTLRQLLPIEAEQLGRERGADLVLIDYLYEQPPAEIFGRLLPRYVETQVYHAMLESVASEHGARMSAMDSASKNAGELIDLLTLEMNRVRQASITREIIEVVSGAQALK